MLELSLQRSALDPWLGVVLRAGVMTGLGLGMALAGVALSVATAALGITGLGYLVSTGLCSLSCPMMVLPLFALVFLQLGGRRLRVEQDVVVLLRTDGPELSRASIESVRASVRKGVYASWGRRGRVLHLGVGAKPVAIGAHEPERASAMRAAGWPVASAPELECTSEELDRLIAAIGLT
ncbi:MAG: hypothetical protein J0L92_24510 [Deltaproteobacteria bacterium]|nr:hypothetical protein [Deltaproteobacteria bacterium]